MTPEELQRLIALAAQLTALAVTQYQKYQQEKGLTDDEMRQHLKDLNAEDAAAFDKILAGQG